jgi:uncharacterized protein (TIGR02996 family)
VSWLEVLSTPPKVGLPLPGDRIALPDGKLTVDPDAMMHGAQSSLGHDGASLMRLAAGNGTCLNGVRVSPGEHALTHGDIVEIGAGLTFRYCEREERPARSWRLEAAIGDRPHDDGRWKVYADWLLEQGDPLGRRMSAGHDDGDDDARWLGPMARPWRAGNLELSWRHGFIRSATFRALEWENSPDTYWCLLRLFELEVARFLEVLHVDLFTTHLPRERPPFEQRARRVLEHLKHAPRTVAHVTLGPVLELHWTPDLERELSRLREERPRLSTTREALVKRFRRMWLKEAKGAVIELTADEREYRFGAQALTLSLGEFGVAWAERSGDLRLAEPFVVNGRSLRQARLMPGDVFVPSRGVRFVVEAE